MFKLQVISDDIYLLVHSRIFTWVFKPVMCQKYITSYHSHYGFVIPFVGKISAVTSDMLRTCCAIAHLQFLWSVQYQ